MNTGEIRKTIRSKRRALTSTQQQTAAENLAALISQQNFFLRAKRIGIYIANDGEIDPSLLMGIALNANKACYLPIITDSTLVSTAMVISLKPIALEFWNRSLARQL